MQIIVVGAGIAGCAVAHELASRGAHVRVLDPRGVGLGATRASAGMLTPWLEGHSDALLRLTLCSLSLYDEFVVRVRSDSTIPLEYERTGSLQVALRPPESDELVASAARLEANGVPHTLLTGPDARKLEPALSDRTCAALLVPAHGYVAPRALTAALADAAIRRGAVFSTGRAVRVRGDERGAQVDTPDGTIAGDAVILAAGSWSSALVPPPGPPPPVTPIRGQLVQLQMPERPMPRVAWGGRCYMVPWHDGTVLVGATVEDVGFDETNTARGVRDLLDAAIELVPALKSARFSEARAGLRPKTVDELPAIGPSSAMKRVFYAAGHYRNGVLLAPLTARLVADVVLESREPAELALVHPSRLGL